MVVEDERMSNNHYQPAALLTSAQVAGPEWLALPSAKTLDAWAYRGIGPKYVKVGKHRRYRPEDVQAWIGERTVTPGAA